MMCIKSRYMFFVVFLAADAPDHDNLTSIWGNSCVVRAKSCVKFVFKQPKDTHCVFEFAEVLHTYMRLDSVFMEFLYL